MRKHLLLFFFLCSFLVQAQTVPVPETVFLANQQMILSEGGRQEIQKRVDALMRYPKSFLARVDLADTYFPIIERVFREEGLPEDFKYIVLIESGLIPDAVSTSNAVGFWQFKKDTATDYGLKVNQDVDERKHITESSRSAARYLIKSNNLYYNNWHNTVLSYYYGFTGAKAYARPEHQHNKEMAVTEKTDNYILKLIAHKIAYESAIGKNPAPGVVLQEIPVSGKSLSDVALEVQVAEGDLQKYNKWLSGNYIPNDKTYTLLIPITNPNQQSIILASQQTKSPVYTANTDKPAVVTEKVGKREFKKLNGLKVIIARKGDTKDKLALQARMSTRKFLSLNDMYSFDPIVEGEAYYIERKKTKASVAYHVVKAGERIQHISQRYGVKAKTILWNNRMKPNEVLAAGRLLWMQHRRPSGSPIEFQKVYPDAEPKPAPRNPVILAKDEVLDELNADKSTASSQGPDETKKPTKDYAGGKMSGPAPVAEPVSEPAPAVETAPEKVAVLTPTPTETAVVTTTEKEETHPMDAALATTNDQAEKTEMVLAENIDQQVENKNEAAEVPADLPEPAKETKPVPTVVMQQPAPEKVQAPVVLQEPAPQPKVAKVVKAPPVKEPVKEINTSAPAPLPGIHVVAKGETLYGISKKYGITTENIKSWNTLGDLPLAIGQTLKIVAPAITSSSAPMHPGNSAMTEMTPSRPVASATGGPATHTVSNGESMYQISRRYGVTIKDIMEWNKKSDFNVSPGERLVIKAVATSRE